MLRLRHGVGQSVRFTELYRISARALERGFAQRRTFATENDKSDQNDTESATLSNTDVEARLKDLANLAAESRAQSRASSRSLRREKSRLRAALRRDATAAPTVDPSLKKPHSKKQNETEVSSNAFSASLEGTDNFDEALDVVRKVYGVQSGEGSKRRRKKKKKTGFPAPSANDDGFEMETGEPSVPSEIDPLGLSFVEYPPAQHAPADGSTQIAKNMAQSVGMGVFSSLKQKLKGLPTNESTGEDSKLASEQHKAPEPTSNGPIQSHPTITPAKKGRPSTKSSPQSSGIAKKWENQALDVKSFMPKDFDIHPVEDDKPLEVPRLAHNLDRVLFNPGVYDLQDKRSRVYNFDPYLASIMPVQEFDFDALKDYITSSEDVKLRDLCKKHEKKYCGSTSSMTAILSQLHFLLSAWRNPNFSGLSRDFEVEFEGFTRITRAPAAAFARLKDGVYAIDADKQFDTGNILSMLGKSMEKLLTLPKEDFEKYRRTRSHQLSDEEKNAEEGYHYTTFGDFMMRSQLDAYDPRLPGTGMFDLKTRAVVPIRMDASNHEKGVGYEIRFRTGQWESYEREYYDMIRSAFLKYSLQVRMGRMDGIFVAFHNTQRIFGFQYVPLSDMDLALHGTQARQVGDEEFKASLYILNDLLDRASTRFPGKSLRLHVETRETKVPLTYFFVEPVNDGDIAQMQASGEESMEEVKSDILDLARRESEAVESRLEADQQDGSAQEQLEEEMQIQEESSQHHDRQTAWDEMMSKVDETVEDDSKGLQTVRDAIHEALNQSGLLRGKSDEDKESYLNALVEALAAELPGAKDTSESRDIQQPVDQDDVENNGEENGEENGEIATLKAESSNHIDFTAETEDSGANTTELSNEDTKPIDNSIQDASLKDLILKVAQNVENKSDNLGVFEQVLSKLAAEANNEAENNVSGEKKAELSAESATGPTKIATEEDIQPVPGLDKEAVISETGATSASGEKELLGLVLTIQNKSKGEPVERITTASGSEVEYLVTELQPEKAKKIYQQIKNRRKTAFQPDPEAAKKQWYKMWGGRLPRQVSKGRIWRQRLDLEDSKELKVVWDEKPVPADTIYPTDPDVSKV